MRAAIKNDGMALIYASERLESTPSLALAAIGQDYRYFNAMSVGPGAGLRHNHDFILAAIKLHPRVLEYFGESINDPIFMLDAVRQSGMALAYASDELKSNPEIVLAAIRQKEYDNFSYEEKLQLDKVQLDFYEAQSIQFASKKLQNDPNFVLSAVKQNGAVLVFVSEKLQNDYEIALSAIKQNPDLLDIPSLTELTNDPQFILRGIEEIQKFFVVINNIMMKSYVCPRTTI